MENPGYYAIIPANVRYDPELPANAKLLYGELTALAHKEGYCFASNNYFARLYGVTPQAVSRWVGALARKRYVLVEYVREGGEIKERRIRLNADCGGGNEAGAEDCAPEPGVDTRQRGVEGVSKIAQGGIKKSARGYQKKVKDNNTSDNNTDNNTSGNAEPQAQRSFAKPTVDEVAAYCEERGNGLDARMFFDFYEAKGWLIGRSRMKDWKACVRTWERRGRSGGADGHGGKGPLWGNEGDIPQETLDILSTDINPQLKRRGGG